MAAGPLAAPRALAPAKAKPSARAPLSPMKIRAGEKLYPKNATHPAARIARRAAASSTPSASDAINVGNAAMAATPAARPSRPSSRLTALLTPTSQRTVTGTDQIPRWAMRAVPPKSEGTEIHWMRRPIATLTAAAATCPSSLSWGDNPLRSSTSPNAKTTAVPLKTCSSGCTGIPPTPSATAPAVQPTIRAMPPSRATGRRWR